MDERYRAQLVLAIQYQFTQTMREVISSKTSDPEEQEQIAGAVLGLMLRHMYQTRGDQWLETVLRQVLQPAEQVTAADESRGT